MNTIQIRAPLAGHIFPVKMPWPEILHDIKTAGCSRYRIAIILGVGESTVEGWENGSDPRHAMGQAVLMLHATLCPNATEKRCNPFRV